MKKLSAIITVLFAGTVLSGCSVGAGIDTLMAPPKLSLEQEQIYTALTDSLGTSNISLKYPKSGKYLSAFIIEDIDGDGYNEAMVFYEKNNRASDENPLRINILDKDGGEWRSVNDKAAAGSEVEEVIISRLGSENRINLIIGTSSVNRAEKNVSIYNYSDGELRQDNYSKSYSYMDVVDLNNDDMYELVLIAGSSDVSPVTGDPLKIEGPKANNTYVIEQNRSFTQFDVNYGDIGGIKVMYIDAASGENLQSYILYMDSEGKLQIALKVENRSEAGKRLEECRSFDIDGDGCLEIPFESIAPGSENAAESEQLMLTRWMRPEGSVRSGECSLKECYISYFKDGYVFIFPEKWNEKVTVKHDVINDETVFCSYDENGYGADLMRIFCAEDVPSLEDRLSDGYMLIHTKGNLSYLVYIHAGSNAEADGLAISAGDAALAFRFME